LILVNKRQSITNSKHACIIKLLYGCGLRLNELLHLKISDIDSENLLIHIRHSKGNKDRVGMLPPTLLPGLLQGLPSERVFV
jgi:integrase